MHRRFVRKSDTGWDGVPREGYVAGQPGRVLRNTLVGRRKSEPADPGPSIEVRYFEVPPGAATRLEKHAHEHVVIGGEGTGHALVGTEVRELRPRDVVYVAPFEPHQFVNRGSELFGFFCIVAAHRDYAQPLDAAELSALLASAAGAYADTNSMVPSPPETRRGTAG
ncbi:MAG: cupin domain-containing protein [Candidatus Eremiobacteraeota bacterium]|nr:cupin domain-containing protein [Candidatus Eremiobacteraeota bacterium]MBV9645939.1 cupin domain-containing protein [Candidatus Eremiobacteraeota bacterium]